MSSTVGRNTSGLGVGTGILRRIGREGSVLDGNGNLMAEVVGIGWTTTIEQIAVTITGSYQDEVKPGSETRTFTLTVQNVDDYWNRLVWAFVRARRQGAAATFPKFNVQTKLATPGAPETRWALSGCQVYSFGEETAQSDGVLQRQIAGTYDDEAPIDSFEYTGSDGHGNQQSHVFGAGEEDF